MKFIITFLVLIFTIIDGIQNAPAIHPIHVQTVPLRPVTVRPTFPQWTTRIPIVSSVTPIRSSPRSSTSAYHTPWWKNSHSAGYIILRIGMYGTLALVVGKVLDIFCKSKKQKKTCEKECPDTINNKMCISTVDGKREESPPSYANIHTV